LQVANDPDKAEAVAEEADRLDEMAQKAQAQAGANASSLMMRTLVHMPTDTQLPAGESTGVITISVASKTLGQINTHRRRHVGCWVTRECSLSAAA